MLSSQFSSAKSHTGVLCYRSRHGALSENKLLKTELAGKYYNLHIKLCGQENPLHLDCKEKKFSSPSHCDSSVLAFPQR